ncbi:hypothetical protein [uncultured Algibacter sp.]|uniref:hypothetical protein n=1 Tax=uncultured Algibacter sp. TaxID=298659 RepID=UPI00262E851C|nr:hypothetical protein [uncultured Algibacter sp.]
MKNIKILMLFFASLFVFVSCEEEDYVEYTAPDDLSDAIWLAGIDRNTSMPYSINAESAMAFFNLSQGTVSSEWTIEEGNKFLKLGWSKNDSLDLFIDPDAGLKITTGKANVLFKNSGINTVTLLNKFNEPTNYNISDTTNVKVKSFQEDDLHVIETKFLFDVYAIMKPAFTVLKDGVNVLTITEDDMPDLNDSDSWPIIEVEAATGLQFIDNTTIGRPNSRTWLSPDGIPNKTGGLEPIIKFYRLGTFNAGTLRTLRINELPKSTAEKIIPLKVKVITSSQPFVFDGVLKEAEDEVISFRVNGEVKEFSGEEGNFIVNVKNAASGFDQVIPVQVARVSEENSIFIELVLSAPIYNSDEITVSYSGGGILSADNRPLEAFSDKIVEMNLGNNILPANSHASYEQGNSRANNAFAENYFLNMGNRVDGKLVYERVTTKSFDGEASMRFVAPEFSGFPNINLWSFGLGEPEAIPAGTYVMSYHIFKDVGTTITHFRTEQNKPDFQTQLWDISAVPNGQWTKVTKTFTTGLITPEANLRFAFKIFTSDNPGVAGPQTLYIDNLAWFAIEPRP